MLDSLRSFCHMLRLPMPQAEAYCRQKRLQRFEKYGGRVRFLRLHALGHRVLVPLMRLEVYAKGKRLVVLRDSRRPSRGPVIYCPTHIGGADIEMSFLAIRSPCWLVLGDPREIYRNVSGLMLQLNGLIPFDTQYKQDRRIAKAQMAELLKKGGSLLIFPEGCWNISPNGLLNHLYVGAVELAIACGAEIVPIAIEREDNTYYVALGENISYSEAAFSERFALNDALRDRMAALKLEIIERFEPLKRAEIPADYFERIVLEPFFHVVKTYTMQDIRDAIFHPKGLTDPADAFAHLAQIEPRRENAFLFNKRLRG
ncbi:MAG: 1-acyl-sn-glycerol-3-phosphate acyltransferase [Clostridia bacterium]|nr:1-acyl-sn-glycerol-3-phosphate acyltransferase [Clostridia bacterium]